jgi:RNA:NAD 2'-phosphotransferase (TPT1/KptA family)
MEKTLRLDKGQIEVVDDVMAEILRHKTPAERIRIGFDLWISARNMLMTHLKKTHPEWDTTKLRQEVARRLSHGAV